MLTKPGAIGDAEALALTNNEPAAQGAQLGSRLQELYGPTYFHIQKVEVAADASAGVNFLAGVTGELVDAWAVSTATIGAATIGIRRSSTALTTLIAIATVDVLTRGALILQSGKAITAGETLNVKTNGATDRGIIYLKILKTAA